MTDLLAIGTRKGLWLARSDDDRRTWTLDGPHLLAQEVAAVSIDTRGATPRVLAGIQYGHWGPTVMWSDDLGAHLGGDRARRDPLPRGHRRGAGPRLAAAPGHRRAARRRLGRLRAALAVAQRPTAGCTFELVRGLLGPPAPAHLGARRRGRGGAHGAARPGVGPGDRRDEHRRRLRQRGRRREVGAAQPAASPPTFMPGRAARVRAVRAQGGGRRGRPGPDVRAEPLRRLPHRRRRRLVDVDRRAACRPTSASRSSSSPRTPGTAWVMPLVADMQRVPPDGRLRVHRTRDAGETWTELGDRPARRLLDGGAARRVLRRRGRPDRHLPGHPRRLRLRQRRRGRHLHRWWPTTCPTSSPCARPGCRERAGGAARRAGRPGRRRPARGRASADGPDATVGDVSGRARRRAPAAGAGGSATRPGRCAGSSTSTSTGRTCASPTACAPPVRDGAVRAGAAVGRGRLTGGGRSEASEGGQVGALRAQLLVVVALGRPRELVVERDVGAAQRLAALAVAPGRSWRAPGRSAAASAPRHRRSRPSRPRGPCRTRRRWSYPPGSGRAVRPRQHRRTRVRPTRPTRPARSAGRPPGTNRVGSPDGLCLTYPRSPPKTERDHHRCCPHPPVRGVRPAGTGFWARVPRGAALDESALPADGTGSSPVILAPAPARCSRRSGWSAAWAASCCGVSSARSSSSCCWARRCAARWPAPAR